MFMEPIEIAAAALTPAPRRRSAVLKLAVGIVFLLVCGLLMLPWAALTVLWFGFAAGARAIGGLMRELKAVVMYSGETVLGR